MIEKPKISTFQFMLLVILYTIGTTILIIPSSLAADAKQDAWIAALLGLLFGLLNVWFFIYVGKMFPDKTLVEVIQQLLGKWLGSIVSLLFVFYGFIGASTLLFYVCNFITTQVMPETPVEVISILFAFIVLYGLRLGLETLSRSAEILFPWFIFLYISLIVMISPEAKFINLQPIMEAGLKPILKATVTFICTFSIPVVTLLMVFPSRVNQPDTAKKGFLWATFIGGIVILLITIMTIAVLGPSLTERQFYPTYTLAQKINIGNFLQRIEAIVATMWMITIYYKLTLYFYSSIVGFAQIFKLKDYRPLLFPFGILLVVYSLVVYPNVSYMQTWDTTVYLPYAITFGFILPLSLLIIHKLKQKLGKGKGNKNGTWKRKTNRHGISSRDIRSKG